MPIGETLRQSAEHYKVNFDEINKVWRIVDLWHESLGLLEYDSELPDDHPAVITIPELAFMVLVEEADRLGIIDRLGHSKSEKQEINDSVERRLSDLNAKLLTKEPESESFRLRKRAMDSILKIVAVDAVNTEIDDNKTS